MTQKIHSAVQKIKDALGGECLALLRYEKDEKNTWIFVVEKVDFTVMESVKKQLKKINFLIFRKEEIVHGADVFPIEFLNLKRNVKRVEGENFFKDLVISKKDLRWKLEFELRNKLIYLREQFLQEKGKAFLPKIFPTFVPIFVALCELFDVKPKKKFSTTSRAFEKSVGVDLSVFRDLEDLKIDKSEISNKIQAVNDAFEQLAVKVNHLKI